MSRFADRIAFYRASGKRARDAHMALKAASNQGLIKRDPAVYAAILKAFYAATTPASPDVFAEDFAHSPQDVIDEAIAFLSADAYFFRSGYLKQAIIRKLKRVRLDRTQTQALETLVLHRINDARQFHFADYARLAVFLDSPAWSAKLNSLPKTQMTVFEKEPRECLI